MRLNRELRTKHMTIRFHILWVIFYILLITGFVKLGLHVYREHDEDQFPPGSIVLKVSKTRYKPGEAVSFSIQNQFPNTIYVTNNCPEEPLNVYRWDDNRWEQTHATAKDKNSNCHKQPRHIAIKPNSTRKYDFKDWPTLFKKPGVYRLAMKIDHSDEIVFDDFVVLRPARVIKKPGPENQSSTREQTTTTETPTNTAEQKQKTPEKEPEIENEIETEDDD